jgi:CubicO group peptidase (beta-lactamase class C family)
MIDGSVAPGFEQVRREFERNFAERRELGAACAAYVRGEEVVDLWGGIRDARDGSPWEQDTLVLVYSTSKGLAAMTLALAHSRGWLDYDERVTTYWPEFGQAGKQDVTVRQLLGHEAGVPVIDEPLEPRLLADFDALAEVIARQRPLWEPGTRHGYHGVSLGWYEGELVRRLDPQHRTLGRFFAEEIAGPLGLDVHFGIRT